MRLYHDFHHHYYIYLKIKMSIFHFSILVVYLFVCLLDYWQQYKVHFCWHQHKINLKQKIVYSRNVTELFYKTYSCIIEYKKLLTTLQHKFNIKLNVLNIYYGSITVSCTDQSSIEISLINSPHHFHKNSSFCLNNSININSKVETKSKTIKKLRKVQTELKTRSDNKCQEILS